MFLVAIVWLGHFFLRMQSGVHKNILVREIGIDFVLGFRAIYWLKCAILETILAFIVWLMIVVKRGNLGGQRLVNHPIFRPLDGCRTSWKRNRSE